MNLPLARQSAAAQKHIDDKLTFGPLPTPFKSSRNRSSPSASWRAMVHHCVSLSPASPSPSKGMVRHSVLYTEPAEYCDPHGPLLDATGAGISPGITKQAEGSDESSTSATGGCEHVRLTTSCQFAWMPTSACTDANLSPLENDFVTMSSAWNSLFTYNTCNQETHSHPATKACSRKMSQPLVASLFCDEDGRLIILEHKDLRSCLRSVGGFVSDRMGSECGVVVGRYRRGCLARFNSRRSLRLLLRSFDRSLALI